VSHPPSSVRWWVLAATTLASLLLYLDRMCVSIAAESMRTEFGTTKSQEGWFLSAFFWSYALFQVPSGMLSDRFGIRRMLVIYILAWSAFTGVMGLANSFVLLIVFRLGCGLAQAGAYPSASRAVRDWTPYTQRGFASSMVAFGGRIGGAVAPALTGWMMLAFALQGSSPAFRDVELRNRELLLKALAADDTALVKWIVPDWQRRQPGLQIAALSNAELLALVNATDVVRLLPADEQSLPAESLGLLDQAARNPNLSDADRTRINRRLWEQLVPGAFRKLEARGWRPVMIVYGAMGLFVAAAFWIAFRETPAQHPWCNDAERQLIGNEAVSTTAHQPFPWGAVLTNRSLWGNCIAQIGTNVGWVFLVTWLPRYLDEVHHVPVVQRGLLASLPLLAGMPAMLLGGPWTDIFTQRFGRLWGRRLPVVLSRITAALGYGLCLLVSTGLFGAYGSTGAVAAAVIGTCLVAVSTDLGVPATWAFMQDIGGRHTAAVLGWGNMWGNLGAAAAPFLYNGVLGETPTMAAWNWLFVLCAGAFVVAGVSSLWMDASRPLVAET
jgi:ACS family glucarate transporter-like MFS transporter